MTRERHEAEPNWQATYHNPKTGRYSCVMRTLTPGSYYWSHCDYEGLFTYGGTMNFSYEGLQFNVENGYAVLVTGEVPAVIEPVHDPIKGYWNEQWYNTGHIGPVCKACKHEDPTGPNCEGCEWQCQTCGLHLCGKNEVDGHWRLHSEGHSMFRHIKSGVLYHQTAEGLHKRGKIAPVPHHTASHEAWSAYAEAVTAAAYQA